MSVENKNVASIMHRYIDSIFVINNLLSLALSNFKMYNEHKGTLDPVLYEKCHVMFISTIESLESTLDRHTLLLNKAREYLDSL